MADKAQKVEVKTQQQSFKYLGALEMVLLRNYYYRDSYRKLMILCLCLLFAFIGLIFFLLYEQKHIPPPVYFATTYDGTPIQLVPLNRANMQANALIAWSVDAATSAYSINFINYRRSIQNARAFFTRKGYQSYLKAIKESRNLDAVQKRKMIVYAKLNGTPTILQDSSINPNLSADGRFAWQVQIPLVITYENSNPDDKVIQNNVLTMLITRVSSLEATAGVGIDSFVLRQVIQ